MKTDAGTRTCMGCNEPIPPGDLYDIYEGSTFCGECLPKRWKPPELKRDTQKPRYDLIPSDSLHAIALVLTYGADKYEDRGWESGTRWGRYFAACMRHLWAWWRGEELDPESGLPHLAHAGCCVMFLLAYECRGVGEDDRKQEVGDGDTNGLR